MRNKELLHRFENISSHLEKIRDRLDSEEIERDNRIERIEKLEQEIILLRYYNGLTIKELEKLYGIARIEEVLSVQVIDNVKFAVFQKTDSRKPTFVSQPGGNVINISPEELCRLMAQQQYRLDCFNSSTEIIRRKFIEPEEDMWIKPSTNITPNPDAPLK